MLKLGRYLQVAAISSVISSFSASCASPGQQTNNNVGSAGESDSKSLKAFSPNEFRSFPISRVERVSPNTKLIELALPSPDHEMGLEVCSHVLVQGPADREGKLLSRPYTPVSLNEEKGRCALLVKAYPQGRVSSYLHSLSPGDYVSVQGPFVSFPYTPNRYRDVVMLAGGTGVTPMLQLLRRVLANAQDKTRLTLVCAADCEDDLLLKDSLDALAKVHANFSVQYVVLNTRNIYWPHHRGYVSYRLLRELLPPPSEDVLVLVCGPPLFVRSVAGDKAKDGAEQGPLGGLLRLLGYTENMVFKF